jgi:hypothetical protein
MNKNEQNRVVAWRLKLLRQASDLPRGRRSDLPTFRPFSQNLLQMESQVQESR